MLLCTDLDRTLIPNGEAPESAAARPLFRLLSALPEVRLVYVSGRDRSLVEQAIAEFELPMPEHVIADVGATIYDLDGSAWQRSYAWENEISPDWAGLDGPRLHALLADTEGLRLQEPQKQGRFKLSYYTPLVWNQTAARVTIESRLQAMNVHANLIWSVDEAAEVGLLDILPASANKLHAIEFLATGLGLAHADILFAGDSGNDIDVLISPVPSVLVANASDELRRQVLEAGGDVYPAEGGYLGMNGNYSAGILEGVAHYHADYDQWLRQHV